MVARFSRTEYILALKWTIRMYQDLRIAVNPLIELLIRRRRIIDIDIMRDNEARLRLPCDDQVAKKPVVLLHIALARPKGESLFTKKSASASASTSTPLPPKKSTYLLKQLSKTHHHHPLPTLLIRRPRITRDIQARHTHTPRRPRHRNTLLNHNIRHLLRPLSRRLIPHRIDTPIHHPAILLNDTLHRVPLAKIHRHTPNLSRGLQPLRNPINNKNFRSPPQCSAISSHKPHRPGSKYSNRFPRLETGKTDPVPARWEDIREQRKIRLMFRPRRQLQGVEVRVRYAEVLSLPALIGAHGNISVCTTREAGVYACAEGCFALFAVLAAAVGDIEGEDDAVVFLEEGDAGADLGDDAHVFMAWEEWSLSSHCFFDVKKWREGCTEYQALLCGRPPLIHVQI